MNNSEDIEIRFMDLSTVLKPSDSYALVLKEADGKERKLALIIGASEAQAIRMAQLHYNPPRPFTHDLMLNVMYEGGLKPVKAVIYEVKEGIYYSYLYVQRVDGSIFYVDARTTDVVSLSMRNGFPLYVKESILDREHLREISDDGSKYSLTLNAVDVETLKQAMSQAVACEDYERASMLRDEIRKREKTHEKDKFMSM